MLAKRLLVSVANSLSSLAFRVRAKDAERVPSGAAVLLTSEVSLSRALAIHRASARPVHFWWDADAVGLVDRRVYDWLNIHTVFPNEQSLAEARPLIEAQLKAGALVCSVPAFASDRETVSTAWLDLLREAAAAARVPFVPVGVDLQYDRHVLPSRRSPLHRVPPRIPGDITVSFRAPLEASSGQNVLIEEVQLASHEAYSLRHQSTQPLHRTFIELTRRNPFAVVCYDGERRSRASSFSRDPSRWLPRSPMRGVDRRKPALRCPSPPSVRTQTWRPCWQARSWSTSPSR